MQTFTARYSGRCAADCGRRIVPGDEVFYDVGDELVHASCPQGDDERDAKRPVCTACWLVKPCGCDE